MKNLNHLLKSLAVNGSIPLDKALKLADQFDQERNETKELLKNVTNQVGLHWGEEIKSHLAKMDGTKFDPLAFHYERLPDGQ